MSEWGVVGVIAALVGLFCTVLPPITKLNTSIVELRVTLDGLQKYFEDSRNANTEDHKKMFAGIADHEKRISKLER